MSPDASTSQPEFIIAGCLTQDYILPISGRPQINVLGGNLPYAAVGLNLWGKAAGMLARLGANYSLSWLDRFRELGFDLAGIKVLPDEMDLRRFLAYPESRTVFTEDPVRHFADRGLAFPPELLGYRSQGGEISSRTTPLKQSLQISDIPGSYLDAAAVHICPIDYLSHLLLPSIFRQGQAGTITLSPTPGYMSPSFWEEIPGLLSDVTAFIVDEPEVAHLFQGRSSDLWEMANVLAEYGPEIILIRSLTSGYHLFDRVGEKRWIVPEYQINVADPTGVLDAFAGGFLAGYPTYLDPVESAVRGAISASLVAEGSGVFYALDAMPELVEGRLTALRELVRPA